MRFCKKCHKRMVKVLTTVTGLKNSCLCNDDGLVRIEGGSEAMGCAEVGALNNEMRSKGNRRNLLRDLRNFTANTGN